MFEIKRVIVGQERMVERMLVSLLARGHCLLEGVPGVAKTLAVETLARTVNGTFSRMQFTPDLVPSDIVGTRIYRAGSEKFETELGPVMANFVLTDEINRAPAKVQSALLEVMAEGHVTIGGERFDVPRPFLVLATQNPIESEGVYPLPEAQRDRFLMKINVDYPTAAEEREIVYRMGVDPPSANPVISTDELQRLQVTAGRVFVHHAIVDYVVRVVVATRHPAEHGMPDVAQWVAYGASPRASLGLIAAAARWHCCAGATTCCPRTSSTWPLTCSPTGWYSATTRSPTAFRPSTPCAACCRPCRCRRSRRASARTARSRSVRARRRSSRSSTARPHRRSRTPGVNGPRDVPGPDRPRTDARSRCVGGIAPPPRADGAQPAGRAAAGQLPRA